MIICGLSYLILLVFGITFLNHLCNIFASNGLVALLRFLVESLLTKKKSFRFFLVIHFIEFIG